MDNMDKKAQLKLPKKKKKSNSWIILLLDALFCNGSLKLPFCLYFSVFTQRMVVSACNFCNST